MFLENNFNTNATPGWIEVIVGSMFSGKTEELIRRLKRAEIAQLQVGIFKPQIDKRYAQEDVVSHNANAVRSVPVACAADILPLATAYDVIGIDEAQFFDMQLPQVCNQLANRGKRIILAGLDMDFKGNPFGPIPNLMAIAEYVTKVHAICIHCGQLAHYSSRLSADDSLVVLGEKKEYEPLCRSCYQHSQARLVRKQ